MPTPFMHLDIAEQIRRQTAVQPEYSHLHQMLQEAWPAFYLGSVAPDINAIDAIRRRETHFYGVPPDPEEEAYPTMLATYPQLANPTCMTPAQALFVAAYSAHLMLDLIWLRQVIFPFFVQPADMGDRQQRTLIHFILLTYLDNLSLGTLPETAAMILEQAEPKDWLPFASDALLIRWRNLLVAQLQPGAPSRTVEIYAGRLDILPEQFAANLQDDAWMETHVFSKIPVAEVQAIVKTAVPKSIDLMMNYLQLT